MIKGWLKIKGLQDGERELEEQMLGLENALAECKNKTILDLGCAEGAIGIEFAKAGAKSVVGWDYKREFIDVAKQLASNLPQYKLDFNYGDLSQQREYEKVDIVLALAILHKLPDPIDGVLLCTKLAKELIVIRLPIGSRGFITSKHSKNKTCDIRKILAGMGWEITEQNIGPRTELVQYWRKIK